MGIVPRRNRPRQSQRHKSGRGVKRTKQHGHRPEWGMKGLDPNYRLEHSASGDWHVREIPSWRAVKTYTCPGCLRQIPTGQAHVVAWRADWIMGDEQAGEYRRHWHRACWTNRRQDLGL
ncbi:MULTISPECIES: hypothetical protein [Auritidibacter]|uniref:hypothetical protein n=1 Tax=Auritidibacter TaxID=1160973 RepID=UPI001FEF5280|nr:MULTISPECIES: hypothetical protein [Auritidibacter]WHS28266.1 hypothetical protein QM395_00570 [Auritidibacter ignavus]